MRDAGGKVCRDNNAAVRERVGDLEFEFVAGEFFQNNPFILPEFVSYGVSEAKGPRFLVDAYCGVGMFALSAAKEFERVAGIEVSANAVECARKNAGINNIANCSFFAGKAENIFESVSSDYPDRKSTRLNSSHSGESRMPSSA